MTDPKKPHPNHDLPGRDEPNRPEHPAQPDRPGPDAPARPDHELPKPDDKPEPKK